MNQRPPGQAADEMLRCLGAAIRSVQLYSRGHPLISRNLEAFIRAMRHLHEVSPTVVIGIVGDELIFNDAPLRGDSYEGLIRRFKRIAVERVTVDRGVTDEELAALVTAVTDETTSLQRQSRTSLLTGAEAILPPMPHIRVGRVAVDDAAERAAVDASACQRLYNEAVTVAEAVWESARLDGQPDPGTARAMVDGLAEALSQNRTTLLALTTLKNHDNYTFTHMVNVSLLTMGQARALGVEGPLLREFGLAALMHDIGKVRTPLEILNKPEKLTDAEFAIMQRHTVDGAEMLRGTPDMPTLAPVVAFEHHLRLDGSGYPAGVRRASLNLATMLCSIADVYDAMRSRRAYQQAFPSERILEVLKRNDGHQFDRHLVRRFSQLIGIYPTGTLVRLDTGEVAVVVNVHAPDPHRPQVRVVTDVRGERLPRPFTTNLWETPIEGGPPAIAGPLDPGDAGFDPLAFL